MSTTEKRKEVMNYLLERNILLTPEKAQRLADETFVDRFHKSIFQAQDLTILPQEVLDFLEDRQPHHDIPPKKVDGIRAFDWPVITNDLTYTPTVSVLFDYKEPATKRSVQDFVQYFNMRYKAIERMLRQREELSSLLSISRLLTKKPNETIALVGMVAEKQTTKNNNIIVTVEDPTGVIKVIVTGRNPDVLDKAKDLVLDEVIGITGMLGEGKVIFANNIVHPDIPLQGELKKSPVPGYAVFISDTQLGSVDFLEEQFLKFIKWMRGEVGNEAQRKMAGQVGYLLIGGDIVDGVGIYPAQEDDLSIKDIYAQFAQFAEYLKLIPKNVQIIICPGNHDPVRLAEPQPPFPEDIARPLNELPNVTILSNPCMFNIHESEKFPGFNVLMYHGYSFDYYAANIESIRQNGGYERADLIMKYLMQRRHLAPAHTSTLYVPDPKMDPLVIHQVPDFFLTGHIHYSAVAQYRSVTLINGSCWQGMTSLQAKLGHKPVWARANLIDLRTRKVKVINFDN